ncbi:MAG: UvrB domain 3-containing protein, partial [Vulcanimicrobiota bacterium]
NTMHKIGGKAKAMVVTSSRPHVVRYKQAFDEYLKEKGYGDIKALVAFTSFTDEDGITWTEYDINKIGERELPEKFATDEYQILLVAEKYQKGFDQPLLHTMYVDKKLSGVRAVQTLSRLNRMHPGKEDTFVLDFVNEREDILKAFQPYYEETALSEPTDPNILYDLKNKLDEFQVYWKSEVESFCKVFFKIKHSKKDHEELNKFIDPAIDRFNSLEEEKQDDFKHTLAVFLRAYSFLSQIMPFQDMELEKIFAYGKLLIRKLPRRDLSGKLKLDDEVALEYYRLQKINEGAITLEIDGESSLDPLKEAGQSKSKEELSPLSEIIQVLNERFGTDFTDADKLFFEQIKKL